MPPQKLFLIKYTLLFVIFLLICDCAKKDHFLHLKLKALEYYNNKDFENAEKFFLQHVQNTPDPESYHYLGLINFSNNKLSRAKQHFLQALKLNPKYTAASLMVANIYSLEKSFLAAEKTLRQAYDADKKNSQLCVALGNLYLLMLSPKEAKKWFASAIDRETKDYEVYYKLGQISNSEGDYSGAIKFYSQFLELSAAGETKRLKLLRLSAKKNILILEKYKDIRMTSVKPSP